MKCVEKKIKVSLSHTQERYKRLGGWDPLPSADCLAALVMPQCSLLLTQWHTEWECAATTWLKYLHLKVRGLGTADLKAHFPIDVSGRAGKPDIYVSVQSPRKCWHSNLFTGSVHTYIQCISQGEAWCYVGNVYLHFSLRTAPVTMEFGPLMSYAHSQKCYTMDIKASKLLIHGTYLYILTVNDYILYIVTAPPCHWNCALYTDEQVCTDWLL